MRIAAVALLGSLAACATQDLGGARPPDARVEGGKSTAATVARALDHYRAGRGHYPITLAALRSEDLRAAGADTGAIRATFAAMQASGPSRDMVWKYWSRQDTGYALVLHAGIDSVLGVVATCTFTTSGNGNCMWDQRLSPTSDRMVHMEMWGPQVQRRVPRRGAAFALVVVSLVLVTVGAVTLWGRQGRADRFFAMVTLLNIVTGLLALALFPLVSGSGVELLVIVTLAIWFGSFAAWLLKPRREQPIVVVGAATMAASVVGAYFGVLLDILMCLECNPFN